MPSYKKGQIVIMAASITLKVYLKISDSAFLSRVNDGSGYRPCAGISAGRD